MLKLAYHGNYCIDSNQILQILVWNNYLSSVSAELLANVSVLNDFLLFRDKPELCANMFSANDISYFITALCTG